MAENDLRYQRELEARLAEVEAALLQGGQTAQIRCNAALQMIAGVKREHAAAWVEQNRPNLGPVAAADPLVAAEARLAAVLALCDDRRSGLYVGQEGWIEIAAVRAAAAGADQ